MYSHFLGQHGIMQFGLSGSSKMANIKTLVSNLLYTIIHILISFTCFLERRWQIIFGGDILKRLMGRFTPWIEEKPRGNKFEYSLLIIASFMQHSTRSKPLASLPITIFTNIFSFISVFVSSFHGHFTTCFVVELSTIVIVC